MPERKKSRYSELEAAGAKITSLVNDCQKFFRAHEDNENWQRFLKLSLLEGFLSYTVMNFQVSVLRGRGDCARPSQDCGRQSQLSPG